MVIILFIAGMGQAYGANASVRCLAIVNTTSGINPRIKSCSHCVNHKL